MHSTINIPGTPANKGLVALNERAKPTGNAYGSGHIYGGTVPASEKNRRRAKNRVAKKSRKINRGKR